SAPKSLTGGAQKERVKTMKTKVNKPTREKIAQAPAVTALPGIDDYDVTWDSPSTDARGSMPLGNGDISLNAWVEADGDLQFYIGKTDAWDDNSRLLKLGRVR